MSTEAQGDGGSEAALVDQILEAESTRRQTAAELVDAAVASGLLESDGHLFGWTARGRHIALQRFARLDPEALTVWEGLSAPDRTRLMIMAAADGILPLADLSGRWTDAGLSAENGLLTEKGRRVGMLGLAMEGGVLRAD